MNFHPEQRSCTKHCPSFSVTLSLTWDNHDCLVKITGIGVHQSLSFKGRRGSAEHKGTWNPERALLSASLPSSATSGAWDRVAMPGLLESVWQRGILRALFAVAHAGVIAHYMQSITSDSSLGNTGQSHHGDQRRPERFLNEEACQEILL